MGWGCEKYGISESPDELEPLNLSLALLFSKWLFHLKSAIIQDYIRHFIYSISLNLYHNEPVRQTSLSHSTVEKTIQRI